MPFPVRFIRSIFTVSSCVYAAARGPGFSRIRDRVAALLTAVPAFQYWKAAATTPWRVYRNLLSSIRRALQALSTQQPQEFARLWTIRAA